MIADESKVYSGEPAAIKGLVVSIVLTICAIVTGQTTTIDGSNAISLALVTFIVPLVQAYWTRQSTTAVTKAPQSDAL